jgi:sugar phosphate isomerase/epimerase
MSGAMNLVRAPLVVQPRDPQFDQTVRYAIENGFDLEFIHLADPVALDRFDGREAQRLLRRLTGHAGRRWLHGPFLDLYINSPDERIRQVSEQRIEQCLRAAELLGIERVIFHTNHLPCTTRDAYTVRWRECSIAFWSRMCSRFSGMVLLENMWDDRPELLRGVLDGVPLLAACLDTGHANVFSTVPLAEWIRVLADRLSYVHLSDNHSTADDALPPGDGTIDWEKFNTAMATYAPNAAVMVGMDTGGLAATRVAVQRMRDRGIHPFFRGPTQVVE